MSTRSDKRNVMFPCPFTNSFSLTRVVMRLRLVLLFSVILPGVLPRQVDLSVSSAISRILDRNFADNSGKVDFFLCGSLNSQIGDLFDQIIRQSNGELSIQLGSCEVWEIRLSTSSVLIFESPESFKEIFSRISWQTHKSKRYRHLAYISNGTSKDINDSVVNGWSVDNTAFLVDETEKSISLVTSFMFTEKKCRENQLVTINRFERRSMEWESDVFFPNKYRNLHSCAVQQIAGKYDTGNSMFDKILADMSTTLRFTVTKVFVASMEEYEDRLKTADFDKTVTTIEDEDFIHAVVSSEQLIYIVPPGEPLTKLQKFLSPFDAVTWMFTVATLAMTMLAIQVVSFASLHIRTLCFGRRVGSPTMNLLNIFLCGGQTQDPENYLARYIFLLLLVWSLIIRTCFQSLSYRALQLDNRHPPMRTFDDLRKNDFLQFIITFPSKEPPPEVLENSFYK